MHWLCDQMSLCKQVFTIQCFCGLSVKCVCALCTRSVYIHSLKMVICWINDDDSRSMAFVVSSTQKSNNMHHSIIDENTEYTHIYVFMTLASSLRHCSVVLCRTSSSQCLLNALCAALLEYFILSLFSFLFSLPLFLYLFFSHTHAWNTMVVILMLYHSL